jgi:hypothetical protein
MDKIQEIEQVLFNKFNTSFKVGKDKYGYIVIPNDTLKLARELEVFVDSDDFASELDKIEQAVNILF